MTENNTSNADLFESYRRSLVFNRDMLLSGILIEYGTPKLQAASEKYIDYYNLEEEKSHESYWPERLKTQERRLRKPTFTEDTTSNNFFEQILKTKIGAGIFALSSSWAMIELAPEKDYSSISKLVMTPLIYTLARTTIGLSAGLHPVREKYEKQLIDDIESLHTNQEFSINEEIQEENNLFLKLGKKLRRNKRLRVAGAVAITAALLIPSFHKHDNTETYELEKNITELEELIDVNEPTAIVIN